MKIIRNIPMAIEFLMALTELERFKNDIYKYRDSGDLEQEKEFIRKATSKWGMRLVKDLDVDLHVIGKENLPEKGPVVFVPNHQGYGDIPVCCAVLDKFQTGFIAKRSLSKLPLYGHWIKHIRSVMIERDDPRDALRAIESGIGLIKQGFSLVVFPEGHRSKGGDVAEFKKGSLRLATKTGVPVVPISINGTYKFFEEKGYMQRHFKVDFLIHPPIETAGLDRAQANALSDTVEDIVRKGLEELRSMNK
ncbi:lysophospholipid acyltransferase family protein [Clostridium aminobutyricum]|uniref:1-acyl-sn-glycerol-3-phosphate acyltransferase n=1 Tax=Clostridium aminobutyricum TaxID=33953 RepID=A0A939D9R4_CLOAM|nr:lysophospholipid acyltransferase family protein [Clostridium aminobutyricum]MBN7773363.1 1-acyl-sn-glycerol-3-phosphate acyltransferase [Clostridium aminobutyricum]